MSAFLDNYIPKQPALVRVPRVMFPKGTASVYSTRLFFLLAYHSKFVSRLDLSLLELAESLGIRDTSKIYNMAWWKNWFDDKHTSWLMAPIMLVGEEDETIDGFPMVARYHISLKTKRCVLILNPEARDALRDLTQGFTGVQYKELLNLEHNKAALAYVLFSSIEHLNSQALRTLSLNELTKALDLPDTTNDRKMQEVRRLCRVVQKYTSMKVELQTRKSGRNITGVQFTIRRRIKIKSKFNLRAA
jgi:plasmid replication initiation protein